MIAKLVVWRGEHRKDGPERTTRIGTYPHPNVVQIQTLTMDKAPLLEDLCLSISSTRTKMQSLEANRREKRWER